MDNSTLKIIQVVSKDKFLWEVYFLETQDQLILRFENTDVYDKKITWLKSEWLSDEIETNRDLWDEYIPIPKATDLKYIVPESLVNGFIDCKIIINDFEFRLGGLKFYHNVFQKNPIRYRPIDSPMYNIVLDITSSKDKQPRLAINDRNTHTSSTTMVELTENELDNLKSDFDYTSS